MHTFATLETTWQRTADRQTQLRRAPRHFDDWPNSRRSGLRHAAIAQPPN